MSEWSAYKQKLNTRQRRAEIERCLSEFGLVGSKAGTDAAGESGTRRLRSVLERLGPVFALFGRYLASRVDLFPVQDCLELKKIPDRRDPVSPQRVADLFLNELETSAHQLMLGFDPTPDVSRLTHQVHRARLVDGTPVSVHILRPIPEDQARADIAFFHLFRPALASLGGRDPDMDDLIEDFTRWLPYKLRDLDGFRNMEGLEEDQVKVDFLAAPRVFREFSSATIRTYERLSGWSVADLIREKADYEKRISSFRRTGFDLFDVSPGELVGRIAMAWLHQVFYGRLYPVDPEPEDIMVLSNRKIAFTGGLFTTMPDVAREGILNYVMAVAAHDSERAFERLMPEMEDAETALGDATLNNRFKQVYPFRDGAWSPNSAGDTLPEHLFVHARLVREHGIHPRIYLIDFYRGLFSLTWQTLHLQPDQDAVRSGLKELSWNIGVAETRDMMNLDNLRDAMNKNAASLIQLPGLLNQTLQRLSEEDWVSSRMESRDQRTERVTPGVIGLLSLFVVVILMTRYWMEASDLAWVERAGAGLSFIIGLFILWSIYRNGT